MSYLEVLTTNPPYIQKGGSIFTREPFSVRLYDDVDGEYCQYDTFKTEEDAKNAMQFVIDQAKRDSVDPKQYRVWVGHETLKPLDERTHVDLATAWRTYWRYRDNGYLGWLVEEFAPDNHLKDYRGDGDPAEYTYPFPEAVHIEEMKDV